MDSRNLNLNGLLERASLFRRRVPNSSDIYRYVFKSECSTIDILSGPKKERSRGKFMREVVGLIFLQLIVIFPQNIMTE